MTALEDLVGRQVAATWNGYRVTGHLRWAVKVSIPGCVEVVDEDGEVAIGGMPWIFDAIDPA